MASRFMATKGAVQAFNTKMDEVRQYLHDKNIPIGQRRAIEVRCSNGCLNDAPCPPFAIHGASISLPSRRVTAPRRRQAYRGQEGPTRLLGNVRSCAWRFDTH